MSNYYETDDEEDNDEYIPNPCDLECVRGLSGKEPRVLQAYEGPVKITLVDLFDIGFWPRVWSSALITFANFLIAIVVITVILFSMTFTLPMAVNVHICLCMVGLQLLISSGIFMHNPLFGPASQLPEENRINQHAFLQHIACATSLLGGLHVMSSMDSIPGTPHFLTGLMALFGVSAAEALGTAYYYFNITAAKYIHRVIGLVTFVVSSICACLGILKPSFVAWCSKALISQVPYFLVGLCVIYTALLMMAVKCRIREKK